MLLRRAYQARIHASAVAALLACCIYEFCLHHIASVEIIEYAACNHVPFIELGAFSRSSGVLEMQSAISTAMDAFHEGECITPEDFGKHFTLMERGVVLVNAKVTKLSEEKFMATEISRSGDRRRVERSVSCTATFDEYTFDADYTLVSSERGVDRIFLASDCSCLEYVTEACS